MSPSRLLLPTLALLLTTLPARAAVTDSVRPMLGTAGDGHTFPGATLPFGMVQLSPDTGTQGWERCSGYQFADASIEGFSHTHLSGTGAADLGDLLVQPTVGDARAQLVPTRANQHPVYSSAFSHDQEWSSPGYYKVILKDYKITAELTATEHSGFHQYTFPASDQGHILIDLVHGIGGGRVLDSSLTVENNTTLTGYRRNRGWAQNRTTFFVLEFSKPFATFGLQNAAAELPDTKTARGTAIRAHLDFKTAANEKILIRVGLSPTSIDNARKNLAAEIKDWDFAATTAAARKSWEDALSVISIDTPDEALRQTFYTAIYHTMLAPTLYNDVDRRYMGADGQVHDADFQYYSTFSLWDTFRAEHPLLTFVTPSRVNDFVNSMLVHSEQFNQHTLPVWTLGSNETWTMIGYHSIPVIADAYAKGFRGFDPEKLYAAMRRTATENRNGLDQYQALGYIPSITSGRGVSANGGGGQCVSRTLEYAYDDWCIAQMARALGKADDAALFTKRSQYYRNVFNAETKFMQGRLADGTYRNPFDPTTFSGDFTEGNAWQYSWFVPQDPHDLITLLGGDALFLEKLDQLFTTPTGGRGAPPDVAHGIGQYAHGNEPVHHVPYLFNYAGAPAKTADRVRRIMKDLYSSKNDGLCGNDDCGQMSAWFVLSAMGFYPVNPADGRYILGSPLLDRATIRLDPKYYPNAKRGIFTIRALNNSPTNLYIQSATLNGQPLDRSYFTHADLAAGGELVLQMGDKPSSWATAPQNRP
jgi:predicted alpha-1,2-mannosidase